MTEQMSSEDALSILHKEVGYRLEGGEAAGRDDMQRALQKHFSADEARSLIDGLVGAGALRYHRLDQSANDVSDAGMVPLAPIPLAGEASPGAAANSGLTSAAPMAVIANAGYWQIGGDEGDNEPIIGRRGQVNPA
jgi:hypothetical protein